MEFKNLIYQQDGNVGTIRINRPETKNAIHFDLLHQIRDMFILLKSKDDLEIIILTGYTDSKISFFSSGIDLNDLQKLNSQKHSNNELNDNIAEMQNAVNAIEDVGKVVIAKVSGFCFGTALEIALACDFIISSSETKFGLLETKYGIIPDLGGTLRLVRRAGYQFAKQIIMLADTFSAQEAFRMGVINWVTELENIDNLTKSVIDQIGNNKFSAIIAAKNLIDQIHPIDREIASEFERSTQIDLIT